MTYNRTFNKSNTTGATSGTELLGLLECVLCEVGVDHFCLLFFFSAIVLSFDLRLLIFPLGGGYCV